MSYKTIGIEVKRIKRIEDTIEGNAQTLAVYLSGKTLVIESDYGQLFFSDVVLALLAVKNTS